MALAVAGSLFSMAFRDSAALCSRSFSPSALHGSSSAAAVVDSGVNVGVAIVRVGVEISSEALVSFSPQELRQTAGSIPAAFPLPP